MLNIKEEQQYSQLRKLAQELHIPIFEAFLELEVRDKDGKVIYQHRQRSHSWCRNAYNMMFSQLAGKDADDDTWGAGKLSVKDTGNTLRHGDGPISIGNIASDSSLRSVDFAAVSSGGLRAIAGDDDYGILIGSGTNAESFEDYVLQTKIVNGTVAGQLSYVESEAHAITWTGGTLTLKNDLIRYFNNNSGGSVDVNEVALVTRGCVEDEDRLYLLARDKLGATVTVPDTGQLKVTYTISLTYPA